MTGLRPIRALHYAPELADELPSLIHPSQGVALPARGQSLDGVPALHIGRLIRGGNRPLGEATDHGQSAELMAAWKATGQLVRDPRPAFYLLELGEEETVHWGVAGNLVPTPDAAFRHEETQGERPDLGRRLDLLETQFSVIWGLIEDPQGGLAAWREEIKSLGPPVLSVRDGRGLLHRIWRAEDPDDIEVAAGLLKQPVALADGHHRWQAAIAHRAARRAALKRRRGRTYGFDQCLVWLTPVDYLTTPVPIRCEEAALPDDARAELQAGCLTPATIRRLALAGHVLPPKSTSFGPKPAKGVLMASLRGV